MKCAVPAAGGKPGVTPGRPKDIIGFIEELAAQSGHIEPVDEGCYQAFLELMQQQIEKLAVAVTVWGIVHYLSRSREQSQSGAAALLKKLGSKGEVARDLAYRLYTLCERRKWAKTLANNALVLRWSDVAKLAQQTGAGPVQVELV